MQEMKVVRSGKQKFITWLPCRRGWRGRTSELDAQRRRRVVDSSARKPLRVLSNSVNGLCETLFYSQASLRSVARDIT